MAAISESTAEVKYFVTNAIGEPLSRVLAVAFRRATIEHNFRVAKSEVGLSRYEGRHNVSPAAVLRECIRCPDRRCRSSATEP